MAKQDLSPLTGVLAEDRVVIDFGEHTGKSVLQLNVDEHEYYDYLLEQKQEGNFFIKRNKDKIFRLYVSNTLH
jgi:hypothetical protein